MTDFLLSLPSVVNFILFAILAGGTWFAGSRLTYLADNISDRFNLAPSAVGLMFLAIATSLPEVATTLTAAAAQNADLVLNNLFGGIALQTAILAIADFWARGAITNYPRKANHALEGILLVALLTALQTIFILGEPVSLLNIGLGSMFIGLAYIGTIQLLRWYNDRNDWVPVDLPDDNALPHSPVGKVVLSELSSGFLLMASGAACFAILVCGIMLVKVSETLAIQSGLGSSFFGVTFLAAATSLPELSTTITAARMGAYTLAISNIFGSNLIMVVLVLPADILHTSGPILGTGSPSTQLAIAVGILVTSLYLIGLVVRRKPRIGPIGIDSFAILIAYCASLILFYFLR